MNGIRLLVLIGITFLFASGFGAANVHAQLSRDYGWRVNPEDNVLEFIVQINPAQLDRMTRPGRELTDRERESDLPRELVGRVVRIVVTVGNELLPQQPPLHEIAQKIPLRQTTADVLAALDGRGQGRMTDVEGNSSFIPVQQTTSGAGGALNQQDPYASSRNNANGAGLPALPGSEPGAQNIVDNAANRFLSQAQGTSLPATSGNPTGLPSSTPRFQSTGSQPAFAPSRAGINPNSTQSLSDKSSLIPGYGSTASGNARTQQQEGLYNSAQTGGRLGNERSVPAKIPSLAQNSGFNIAAPNSYPNADSSRQTAQPPASGQYLQNPNVAQQATRPSQQVYQAQPTGQYSQQGYVASNNAQPNMNTYSQPQYTGQQTNQVAQPQVQPQAQVQPQQPPATYIASTPQQQSLTQVTSPPPQTTLANNSTVGNNSTGGQATVAGASPSDAANNAAGTTNANQEPNQTSIAWLQIVVLISLILNGYLVGLLRKLLTRYRTVLGNLRSQTA